MANHDLPTRRYFQLEKDYRMKTYIQLCLVTFILFSLGCARSFDELEEASFPDNPVVFNDAFSGGLVYSAFGGSDVTAFDVDDDVVYEGTASMKFSVPDANAAEGAYAGGVFLDPGGRDLSGYTTLTFWARASKSATIDLIGYGNDLGENVYQSAIEALPVNTNWKKYYIPIPDPSKLTEEKGMFFYSEGPEEGLGYTFWIDEVRFENLKTVKTETPRIENGEDIILQSETGSQYPISSEAVFNLPNGTEQSINASSSFFEFESSDPSVASVSSAGLITVLDAGNATITATLSGIQAEGSVEVQSSGVPLLPPNAAPEPNQDASDVISIYSDAYPNVSVDFYNGFWEFSTTQSATFDIGGNEVLRYSDLNFVGIQFTAPTIDASEMTHFHLDLWTPENTAPPEEFKVLLVDVGADGDFGTTDDSSHELTFRSPSLQTDQWFSLDIPLSDFTGLVNRNNLAQVVLSGSIPLIFVDNMFLYKGSTTNTDPTTAAPNPTRDAAQVISIYSDAYTNLVGTNLNPDWGQGTIFSEESIGGNNTIKLASLDYQGIEFDGSQDLSGMHFLHLDVWTSNSSTFNAFLISTGPIETASSIPVPTSGWLSLDIPLEDFDPVNLSDVIQMKFDGNGTVYLDNIYYFSDDGGGGSDPNLAAPTPTFDQANVISLFSDAYNDVTLDTWRTDWSSATLEDTNIAGNAVKKYSELDFVGAETVTNQIDASQMTHFHIDVWSSDFTFFAIKLVDFGADGAFGGGTM